MGDCILTTPALAILKQARPDVAVAVVVERRFRDLFAANPDISEILEPDWRRVRRFRPDLCLNLHGGGTSAAITALAGSRFRAGFAHFRYSLVYNIQIPRAQEILGVTGKVHTAEHLAAAAFYLGAPRMEIPRARLFVRASKTPARPYAVIHPHAAAANKTWPAQRFLEIARHLNSSFDLEPVFIGGPGESLSTFAGWRRLEGAPLGEIQSVMAGASLFVGNDSGPAHMAAAFGVPVVVIFGSSDPVVWAPWRTQGEVLTGSDGIETVTAAEVREALERLRVRA